MPSPPRPTDAELGILRVLWELGPSTVKEVHRTLSAERELTYTGVLRMLQVMFEKGLVRRDESERSHVYRAAVLEGDTKGQMVSDLMAKAFGGSAQQLMVHALRGGHTSEGELDAIQRLLDEARKGRS